MYSQGQSSCAWNETLKSSKANQQEFFYRLGGPCQIYSVVGQTNIAL